MHDYEVNFDRLPVLDTNNLAQAVAAGIEAAHRGMPAYVLNAHGKTVATCHADGQVEYDTDEIVR